MEEWKPIPGYEGLYEASNTGRIRTSEGKTTSNAQYDKRVWKQRIMKPKHPRNKSRQDGRISLWKDGTQKDYLVSRLIATAWLGVPAPGMTVNHKNGNWQDNRPENLEWISLRENIQHGFQTGLYSSIQKGVVLYADSGEFIEFPSMSRADDFLGRTTGYVSLAKSRGYLARSAITGEKYHIELKMEAG